jgi:hypothetical protein
VYHLSVANMSSSNAQTHCPHAGFSGGDNNLYCGTFCDAYCDNIMDACTGANAVFPDWNKCMQECWYYPKDSTFNFSATSVPTNNSQQCRAWHSQVAKNLTGTTAAIDHCGHASPQGGNVCGTNGCDNYCDNVMAVCNGTLMQYENRAQCMKACNTFPGTGDITWANNLTTSGNSLPCRKYHASVAGLSAGNATAHCIHTFVLGGSGVCGSECEGLCNVVVGACSTISLSTCMSDCAMLNSSSMNTTEAILAGNTPRGTVGCATYWALKGLGGSMCTDVTNALMGTEAGSSCTSAATLLQVSWAVIALVFLALGFTS